jgi:hypothetical protein
VPRQRASSVDLASAGIGDVPVFSFRNTRTGRTIAYSRVTSRADQLEVSAPKALFNAPPSPGPQSFVFASPDAQKFLVVSAGG